MIPARDQNQAPLTKEVNRRCRQKKAIPSETGNEIWLLTLSDLLMLLLIFFVLLFGLILSRHSQAVVAPPPLSASPVMPVSPAKAQPAPPEALPGFAPADTAASS